VRYVTLPLAGVEFYASFQKKVLPKSVTNERILCEFAVLPRKSLNLRALHSANLKVVDLTEEEIAELKEINKTTQFRACPPGWAGWGNLGFSDCES
jgi:hypothetical protein